jgi:ATP phosphoribosyltransferase regulatory subunit
MSSSLSKIPPGVQYIFDAEVRLRRYIEQQVMEVFAGWSYAEIILPIFDYADLFTLGMGKEQAEKTYRFTGRDGKLLALRPDMTSLVARTIATRFRNHLRPIRLSYSGEVFRWDEPRGGRQYEFHQIGLEHIGSERLEADTEVIVITIELLKKLQLEGFTITLSHVDFFNGIADNLKLNEEDRRRLREKVDRKETEQINEFLKPYANEAVREAFCNLATLAGKREILAQARQLVTNEKSVAALDDIERVYAIAEELGIDTHIDIDLGDVGGLDYYTGLTFKIYAQGLGAALGRGGRYNHLLENFGAAEPAVGFSLCLDWLAQLLAPKLKASIEGQIEEATELKANGNVIAAFKEATRLRQEGRKIKVNSE